MTTQRHREKQKPNQAVWKGVAQTYCYVDFQKKPRIWEDSSNWDAILTSITFFWLFNHLLSISGGLSFNQSPRWAWWCLAAVKQSDGTSAQKAALVSREMPSFPHPLYPSSGTAHHQCFPQEPWEDQKWEGAVVLSFLLSTATSNSQPLLSKKWWLQLCYIQVALFWVSCGSERILRISLVTVYKALIGFYS